MLYWPLVTCLVSLKCQVDFILTSDSPDSNNVHQDHGSHKVALINIQILSLRSGDRASSRKAQAVWEKHTEAGQWCGIPVLKERWAFLSQSGTRLLQLLTSILASDNCKIKLVFCVSGFLIEVLAGWTLLACPLLAHAPPCLCAGVCYVGEGPGISFPVATQHVPFSVTSSLILLDTCVRWHLNMLHPAWGTCATDEAGNSNENRNCSCPSRGSFSLSSIVSLAGQWVLWIPVFELALCWSDGIGDLTSQ